MKKFLCLVCLFCSFVLAEDAIDRFAKIDPNCTVWVADHSGMRDVVELEFVTLGTVREPGHSREVFPYFPELADTQDSIENLPAEEQEWAREKVYKSMEMKSSDVKNWVPVAKVPEYYSDNFLAPTAPGFYWANSRIDLEMGKDPEVAKRLGVADIVRETRKLVVVVKKQDGSLGAMESGRLFVAPLNEFGRWSRGISVKSVVEKNRR